MCKFLDWTTEQVRSLAPIKQLPNDNGVHGFASTIEQIQNDSALQRKIACISGENRLKIVSLDEYAQKSG